MLKKLSELWNNDGKNGTTEKYDSISSAIHAIVEEQKAVVAKSEKP